MNTIYLDNNATTQLDPMVLKAMYQHNDPLNPSSVHSFGRKAKSLLTDARRKIADYLGQSHLEIIFTSGATEGLNSALFALASKGTLITSNIEHSAIYETALVLKERGTNVHFLESDESGQISPEDLEKAINPSTSAIALSAVNSETGVKNDIEAFAEIAKRHQIPLIIDGVALLGKEEFKIPDGVSVMCFSAHKLHGPHGTGFSFVRSGLKSPPYLTGGAQEFSKRAGTENLEGILGMAEAVHLLKEALPEKSHQMEDLRDRFELALMKSPGVSINGTGPRIVNVSNISFKEIDGETLLMMLDQKGIAVSHGSACSSGALEPSRVLRNMGIDHKRSKNSLRISLSRFTTREEINEAVRIIQGIIKSI